MPVLQKDLGNVAIIPGLVNAHTHLDFSRLPTPLGQRGIALPDWIRLAMAYRRQTTDSLSSAVADGLSECLRHGVTAVADIVQPDRPPIASPLDVTAFIELIAPTPDRVPAAMELARSHLARGAGAGRVTPGLSPHAPYSVHPELLAAVTRLSAEQAAPVAMHLAESPEELELLRTDAGPFRVLLEEIAALSGAHSTATGANAAASGRSTRPMDYLRVLAAAHRTLVVHGNYLADDEIAFLGARAAQMAAVYCPRSHDWFAHRPYPLEKMLAAGVLVALGTDGRGSTPDLSLLTEMRLVATRHCGVGLDQILRMGTILGAEALGRSEQIGSIAPGKRADLAIVALPDRDAKDPHELLLASDSPVTACWFGGEEVYAASRKSR